MTLGFQPLVNDILTTLEDHSRPAPDSAPWRALQLALAGWTQRVMSDDTNRERLLRFLVADYDLTADEVRWVLRYIYSHLVNKYQGSIAEYLAWHELNVWLSDEIAHGRLRSDIRVIPGDLILERCGSGNRKRWDRGADGLVVIDAPDDDFLHIVAVVEVKSYPKAFSAVESQIDTHVRRLRKAGVRIGERHWPRAAVSAARWDRRKGWYSGSKQEDWDRTLRVLIVPRSDKPAETVAPTMPNVVLQLPASKTLLASTAYALTMQFLERLGEIAFANGRSRQAARDAASNAVKQALYQLAREERAPAGQSSDVTRRLYQVARRLYNVYGFGYVNAEGRTDMLWSDGKKGVLDDSPRSDETRDAPYDFDTIDTIVDAAWAHYRKAHFDKAEAFAVAALERKVDDAVQKRIAWLRAMLRFYQGDFRGTIALMPDPGDKPSADDGWWAKNLLTLIRASARVHDAEAAEHLIERLEIGGSKWTHLRIALPVARGWLALLGGDSGAVDDFVMEAERELDALRREAADRYTRDLGDPLWHEPGAIQAAIVDLAALRASCNQPEGAFELIEPMQGLFAPLAQLIARDPAFDALRNNEEIAPQLKAWLHKRAQEA
jgi:hypothetical protein